MLSLLYEFSNIQEVWKKGFSTSCDRCFLGRGIRHICLLTLKTDLTANQRMDANKVQLGDLQEYG